MTEELKIMLMKKGELTRQQVEGVGVSKAVDALLADNGYLLAKEAEAQVREMAEVCHLLKQRYDAIENAIKGIYDYVSALVAAENKYGELTDDKAKNALAMYSAILNMNSQAGTKGIDTINNAGYVCYAYLGGQARKISDFE